MNKIKLIISPAEVGGMYLQHFRPKHSYYVTVCYWYFGSGRIQQATAKIREKI